MVEKLAAQLAHLSLTERALVYSVQVKAVGHSLMVTHL